jgi:hypothetical protein
MTTPERETTHIQGLVQKKLQDSGFNTEVIDRGYDIAAYRENRIDVGSDLTAMTVGSFLIEVKTTQIDEVKMSPLQAKTAVMEQEKYILCVVDLQNMELPVNLAELQIGQVESAIRMVTNISSILSEPYEWIQEAGTDEIRVDNVQQIRYCVQRNVWENAFSLQG